MRDFTGVHMNGSIPLESAEDVFRLVGENFSPWIRRIPDGEVGRPWVTGEAPLFYRNDAFDFVPRDQAPTADGIPPQLDQVRPKAGVNPADIEFGPSRHVADAPVSFEVFSRLKADGVLPQDARYMMALPGPLHLPLFVVTWDAALDVLPAWERYQKAVITAIADSIPHSELAFQWDLPVYTAIFEGTYPNPFGTREAVVERLLTACSWVPDDVELGFHLCFGDSKSVRGVEDPARPGEMIVADAESVHPREQLSTAGLAEFSNALAAALPRPISFLHMPTLIEWTEPEDYQPLAELKLDPETELYLGVVHDVDGLEGAAVRTRAALSTIGRPFGVSTECGLGRHRPDEVVVAVAALRDLASRLQAGELV